MIYLAATLTVFAVLFFAMALRIKHVCPIPDGVDVAGFVFFLTLSGAFFAVSLVLAIWGALR